MRHWKEIKIPELIQNNCKFSDKGIPYPYIILEEDGVFHFKINDNRKTFDCIAHNKCTICGQPLKEDSWFIGGPASAFHKHGAFNDAPVHKECGVYALKVCPYLAYSRYTAGLSFEKLQKKLKNKFLLQDTTQDPARVPLFVFVKSKNYKISKYGALHPEFPYVEIEYWNDGEQLPEQQAKEIIKKHFEEKYSLKDLKII